MQYGYDPLRNRPSARRGVPVTFLAAIAVVPALLVSAWVVFGGGDDAPSAPSVATQEFAAPSGTTSASVSSVTAGGAAAIALDLGALEPGPVALGTPAPEISAEAAIVVDDASMEVLYEKAGHERRPPASVTKIATAIVAVEHRPLDTPMTSRVHYWDLATEADSTTMGLEPGDTLALRDLLYGLMLVSGNDAALTIAEHVAGSEEAFVREMNALAGRLGLTDTHFTNAAGLYDDEHYSSAWDLVLLSRYLMRFPDLREIVGTEQAIVTGDRGETEVEFDLYNHNPLLNYTPGVDGVKTGFTEEAGRTFSVTAERGGHRVYIVLLDTTARAQDSQALIEWAFSNHRWPDQGVEAGVSTP